METLGEVVYPAETLTQDFKEINPQKKRVQMNPLLKLDTISDLQNLTVLSL